MRLVLHRIYLAPATIGVLEIGNALRLWTIEDVPGEGPNHCISPGTYGLEPHHGPMQKDTWALVGPGVSHSPRPGNRSAILIHSGNTVADSEGCILVGMGVGLTPPAVYQSRLAMTHLREALIIGTTGHELVIRG